MQNMLKSFNGKKNSIANTAFVSEWAYVIGDVEIGEGSGVWPGAVIRADFGSIKIGRNTQVEDNSVIHCGTDMEIGDNVTIGHSVVLHCRRIGNNVLIGNNSTVLDCAEVGNSCVIGANSMVSTGEIIPDNSFVVGAPAKIKKQMSIEETKRFHSKRASRYDAQQDNKERRLNYQNLVRMYKEEGL